VCLSAPVHFLRLLRVNVTWLMGAPAGFKLNRPLATIVGNGVLLWLDMWEFCFSSVLSLVTCSGGAAASPSKVLLLRGLWLGMHVVGVTLQLSLLADAVAICTWSSSWVYQYFAKLNRLQRGLFSSLWNLFLGKKKNVLRRRVDSQEYDISQVRLSRYVVRRTEMVFSPVCIV
jgi:phosphatidylinositol glycan class Q protein